MHDLPASQSPDPALQLQRDIYYQLVHTLRGMMPPPFPEAPRGPGSDPAADAEAAVVRRDRVAIAQVACLAPANADEADIAAQYVAATARAKECMRQAVLNAAGAQPLLQLNVQLNAQCAAMMRQARGYRSLLLRIQVARQKRDASPAAADRNAWTEHSVQGLMTAALGHPVFEPMAAPPPAPARIIDPPAPAVGAPAGIIDPPAPAVGAPAGVMQSSVDTPLPASVGEAPSARPVPILVAPAEQQPDPTAEADAYANTYPRRARLIRQLGGLPDACEFGPPEPELVLAIVSGTSPTLRALDRPVAVAA